MHRRNLITLAVLATAFAAPAFSQPKEIKIAIIASKTDKTPPAALARRMATRVFMERSGVGRDGILAVSSLLLAPDQTRHASGTQFAAVGKKLCVVEGA